MFLVTLVLFGIAQYGFLIDKLLYHPFNTLRNYLSSTVLPSMVFVAITPPLAINPPLVLAQFRREAAKIFRKYKSLRFWTKSGAFSTLAINPPLVSAHPATRGGLWLRIPLMGFQRISVENHRSITYKSVLRDPRRANSRKNMCKTLLGLYPCTMTASWRVRDNCGSISLRVPILGYFWVRYHFDTGFWYQEKKDCYMYKIPKKNLVLTFSRVLHYWHQKWIL